MASKPTEGMAHHVYVPGFASLASFIANDGDHKPSVYKRFDKLATRDLLYYQSQLSALEALQNEYDIQDSIDIEKNDAGSEGRRRWIQKCAESWSAFEQASSTPIPSPGATGGGLGTQDPDGNTWKPRMELAMKIRTTLKDYREALIQESTLLSLQRPSHQTMTAMSNYFHQPSQELGAANFHGTPMTTIPMLSGESSSLYPLHMKPAHIQASDYVSLSAPDESDRLTGIFRSRWLSWLFRSRATSILPQHQKGTAQPTNISHWSQPEIRYYSYRRVQVTVSLITTLSAAILLFVPIYVLYHTSASRPNVTMGLIAMFTVIFSLALAVMTTASRSEIFGASAAYAAVLVVFVSGDFAASGGVT